MEEEELIEVCPECFSVWKEHGISKVRESNGRTDHKCLACGKRRRPVKINKSEIAFTTGLAAKLQKSKDVSRIERKHFRNHVRVLNSVEEYAKNIDETLRSIADRIDFRRPRRLPMKGKTVGGEIGVIQLSDTHFNELIELPHNKYDISIASKRLKLFADEAIRTFSLRGIKDAVVLVTGDLLNSDRRIDERLTNALNRAQASVVAAELLTKFFLHLSEWFNLEIFSVLGNESRIDEEYSFSQGVASNNYDFTIMSMVQNYIKYGKTSGINFGPIDQMELVVDINGHRVLATHDIQKATKEQDKTQSTIGRYHLAKNDIDVIFGGHLHATKIGLYSVRSGSLSGSNAWNEVALGLMSKASQNLGIFGKEYRNIIQVDLQNIPEGYVGYDIMETLMTYNAKSAKRLVKPEVVYMAFQQ